MSTMFTGNYQKSVPKSLEECYKQDNVSENLWYWGDWIESLGKILFIALIIIGLIVSIAASGTFAEVKRYTKTETSSGFLVFVETAIPYAIYAFVEFCVYHVLALALYALARIVQDNNIIAGIASFNAENGAKKEESSANKEAQKNNSM